MREIGGHPPHSPKRGPSSLSLGRAGDSMSTAKLRTSGDTGVRNSLSASSECGSPEATIPARPIGRFSIRCLRLRPSRPCRATTCMPLAGGGFCSGNVLQVQRRETRDVIPHAAWLQLGGHLGLPSAPSWRTVSGRSSRRASLIRGSEGSVASRRAISARSRASISRRAVPSGRPLAIVTFYANWQKYANRANDVPQHEGRARAMERRGEHQASPFRHLSVGRVLVWLHARRRPDAPGHLSVTCH